MNTLRGVAGSTTQLLIATAALALLLIACSTGVKKEQGAPPKLVVGPVGANCSDDRECSPGLLCAQARGRCEGLTCEDVVGASDCPRRTRCCFMPPTLHEMPMCLPDCQGASETFCHGVLGPSSQCNQEAGCCFFPKVLSRREQRLR